jgi:methyl-accepting chemotaxis protein
MKRLFPQMESTLPTNVRADLSEDYKKADKPMLIISIVAFLIVSMVSSYTNSTYTLGIFGGGAVFGTTLIAYFMFRGTAIARMIYGISFMTYTAIMIQQQLGMLEMHFGFFILVALLAIYKDLSAMVGATLAAATYHLLFTYLQLNGVEIMGTQVIMYSISCTWTISFIHIAFFAIEVIGLSYLIMQNSQQFIKNKKLEHESADNIKKMKKVQIENKKVIEETITVAKEIQNGILTSRITTSSSDTNIENLKKVINEMLDSLNKNIGNDINKVIATLDNFAKLNFMNTISNGGSKTCSSLENVQKLITQMLIENKRNGITLEESSATLLSNVDILTTSSNEAASSLEETAASLDEITLNITQSTANIVTMASNSSTLTALAKEGQNLAKETTTAMDEIDKEVNAINDAISVIDQISFQTNILSLNAAVEAATAGEAGKGFAVVAQEVRNLASRSAEAANEIKALVENATKKANNGKIISSKMISGYTNLNDNISKSAHLIEDIENSSKEQKLSIEQINSAISGLDSQTQNNASVASQTREIAIQTDTISKTIVEDVNKKEFEGKDDI